MKHHHKTSTKMQTGPTQADPTKSFADHLCAPFAGLAAYLLPTEWADTAVPSEVHPVALHKKPAGGKKKP